MGRKIAYVNNLLEVGESELGSIYTYDVMIDLPEDGLTKSPAMLVRLDSLAQKAEGYKLTKRTTTVLNIHSQEFSPCSCRSLLLLSLRHLH